MLFIYKFLFTGVFCPAYSRCDHSPSYCFLPHALSSYSSTTPSKYKIAAPISVRVDHRLFVVRGRHLMGFETNTVHIHYRLFYLAAFCYQSHPLRSILLYKINSYSSDRVNASLTLSKFRITTWIKDEPIIAICTSAGISPSPLCQNPAAVTSASVEISSRSRNMTTIRTKSLWRSLTDFSCGNSCGEAVGLNILCDDCTSSYYSPSANLHS